MQFIALHKEYSTGVQYWSEAAQFIKDTAGTDHLREGTTISLPTVCNQKCLGCMQPKMFSNRLHASFSKQMLWAKSKYSVF